MKIIYTLPLLPITELETLPTQQLESVFGSYLETMTRSQKLFCLEVLAAYLSTLDYDEDTDLGSLIADLEPDDEQDEMVEYLLNFAEMQPATILAAIAAISTQLYTSTLTNGGDWGTEASQSYVYEIAFIEDSLMDATQDQVHIESTIDRMVAASQLLNLACNVGTVTFTSQEISTDYPAVQIWDSEAAELYPDNYRAPCTFILTQQATRQGQDG